MIVVTIGIYLVYQVGPASAIPSYSARIMTADVSKPGQLKQLDQLQERVY